MSTINFNGRIAVIFGASRGLGKDIAVRLAKEVRRALSSLERRQS